VLELGQRLRCPLLGVLPFEENARAENISALLDIAGIALDKP